MVIAEKAKENQGARNDICQKSDKSLDTKKELAKIAENMRLFYSYVTKINFPNLTN